VRAHAADSGVAGNSALLVEGEVERQGGDARRAIARNDEATVRQLRLEALGVKARRDSGLAALTIPVFEPLAPPSAPPPVSPVNPAAPVAIPSTASVVLGGVSTGVNLASGAANLARAFKIG